MPPRAFDIALFDLDGTLADTLPLIYEAFDAAFIPALGFGFSPAEIRAMFGPPDHQIIRGKVDGPRADDAIKRFNAHYRDRHDDLVSAFPGIAHAIAACSAAGIKLAVITGKSRLTALITLERLGLRDSFRVIYAGDDVERQKPDPEALFRALQDVAALSADRAVMIGDSAADVIAGKAAGIATIGVTWGSPDHQELEASRPDHIVTSVEELESLLLPR
jgi:HAD superfamily hydrolase (TIGR01509 family)